MSAGAPKALTAEQAKQAETALRQLREGDVAGALAAARRLVAVAGDAPDAHQVLAMVHTGANQPEDADQSFRRALQLAPGHALVLVNYAAFLRRFNRAGDALVVLRQAVAAAPEAPKSWVELGLTALGLGHHAQAIDALENAVRLEPGSALAWHALGNARRQAGELESADDAFSHATALNPGYASAWVNLGVIRRLLGRPDDAVVCFEKATEAGHSAPELADAFAGALLDTAQPAASLEQARRLTREHPAFVPGHVTLASILWEHGAELVPDADPMQEFRAAVLAQPGHRELRLEFARLLLSAREPDEALEQILVLRRQADHVRLVALHAEALEQLGRTGQAGMLYQQVHRDTGGVDPAFLNAYARHLLRAGKWDEAAARAMDATRIDPDDQTAWAYLATAWRLLGDAREFWLCDYERLITLEAIDTPDGYSSVEAFLDALAGSLGQLHQARREPVQQSLRGGSQTSGRLFGRRDPVIEALQVTLRCVIERWLATLPADDSHPFLRRKARSVRFGGSWSVKLWSSGSHANHVHQEGWMSSAFYVALPPSVLSPSPERPDAGYLQFGQPPSELELNLLPRRVVRPAPGKLALFPSYMWHGTVPFEDDVPRLTVAFDMTPLDRAG